MPAAVAARQREIQQQAEGIQHHDQHQVPGRTTYPQSRKAQVAEDQGPVTNQRHRQRQQADYHHRLRVADTFAHKAQSQVVTNRGHGPGDDIEIVLHQRDHLGVHRHPEHDVAHFTQQEKSHHTYAEGHPQTLLEETTDVTLAAGTKVLRNGRRQRCHDSQAQQVDEDHERPTQTYRRHLARAYPPHHDDGNRVVTDLHELRQDDRQSQRKQSGKFGFRACQNSGHQPNVPQVADTPENLNAGQWMTAADSCPAPGSSPRNLLPRPTAPAATHGGSTGPCRCRRRAVQ